MFDRKEICGIRMKRVHFHIEGLQISINRGDNLQKPRMEARHTEANDIALNASKSNPQFFLVLEEVPLWLRRLVRDWRVFLPK